MPDGTRVSRQSRLILRNANDLAAALAEVSRAGGLNAGFAELADPANDAVREWGANTIAGGLWMELLRTRGCPVCDLGQPGPHKNCVLR